MISGTLHGGNALQKFQQGKHIEAEAVDLGVASEPAVALTKCLICESGSLKRLAVPGHWSGEEFFRPYREQFGLCKCRSCSFIFTNPRPSQWLPDLFYRGETYSPHDPDFSLEARKKAEFLLSQFEKHVWSSSERKLLDFGCGGGFLLKRPAASGWDAIGFDIGDRALASCRQQGLRVTDQIEQLRRHRFDIVMLSHVLEHIAEHGALLELLKGLLSEQGKLFIEVPNVRSLRARLSLPFISTHCGFDERYRAFPTHLSYFSGLNPAPLVGEIRLFDIGGDDSRACSERTCSVVQLGTGSKKIRVPRSQGRDSGR